jgi:hypothetical protein
MKNLFFINEEEKNRILNLHIESTKRHYLTLEQSDSTITNNDEVIYANKDVGEFGYGEYESDSVRNFIESMKPKMFELMKQSKNEKFVVKIIAGESNVTNPKGFEEKGSLALARANSVKKYFEEIFPELVRRGTLKINSPKNVSEIIIGKTPYDKNKGDKENPQLINKYKKEQFVKFEIRGIGIKNICDWSVDRTKSTGNIMVNFVTTDEKLKGNGNLTLYTGSIPDRLVVVDKQNKIKEDTGFVVTEKHKYPIFKYVPLYVSKLTGLYKSISVSGSKIITVKVNTLEDLMSQILEPGVSKVPEDSELRRMGDSEIYNGVLELRRLFKKGIREFVIYTISDSPTIKIPYNSETGDYKVTVYSPVGDTGYTITGECSQ